MNIIYKSNKDLPCNQLSELFAAVGWSDESKELTNEMLACFNKPFINSTLVFSAWDKDRLVGCVRVLSDTVFRSVIYDLAVLPEYQNFGIGTALVKKCIDIYPNSEWLIETIPDRVGFYERLGFKLNNNPILRIPCAYF